MKNRLRLIAYCFIILAVLSIGIKTYAVTEEELRNRRDEIDSKIASTNTEIAGIKETMTASLDQINRLNIQIKEMEDTLAQTSEKLEELNEQLEERKQELEKATARYEQQKGLIEKRLIAIYESSRTTYLDILLGSTSLSDFFTKYYILEELAEYDNKLLQSLDVYETAVAITNNLAETKRDEVKNTKDFIEAKTDAMEVLIDDKNNLISNLTQEEIELNQQLEQFEIDKKQIEKELVELARQNAIARSITPSKSGYISPLVGKTKANITTGYNGYAGHTGVDFATPLGSDVVAVKDGTVVISDALRNSNGNYRSYGEYIVIDHHDGTMTLYAHGTPDSRQVLPGDEVVQRTINYEIRVYRKFDWTAFAF
ncbi:MAG: peptidoglycan DD-metalloendopeptidase family protein [Clostridia bacterium]|nr:peptidoglycan DD-metalloendopeptidase family protein [Clostridia bacterium]